MNRVLLSSASMLAVLATTLISAPAAESKPNWKSNGSGVPGNGNHNGWANTGGFPGQGNHFGWNKGGANCGGPGFGGNRSNGMGMGGGGGKGKGNKRTGGKR